MSVLGRKEKSMILYHGSNVVVQEPRILKPSHALDFGPYSEEA